MGWKWIIIFLLLLFLVVFATQNYSTVQIQLLAWSFTTSKAIVIFTSFIAGSLFGWAVTYVNARRRKKEHRTF